MMNRALLTLELRHVAMPYALAGGLYIAYALAYPKPLFWHHPGLILLGLFQGALLSTWIFALPRRWEPYVQTLGASRERIFWIRWTAGIALQVLTITAAWLLLAGGLRMALHEAHLPYYPMIRFFEAHALWPSLMVSLLSFQLAGFFYLRQKFHGGAWLPVGGLLLALFLLALTTGLFLGTLDPELIRPKSALAAVYGAALFGALLAASRHCFRNMEIES
jgi:hypothetical protein